MVLACTEEGNKKHTNKKKGKTKKSHRTRLSKGQTEGVWGGGGGGAGQRGAHKGKKDPKKNKTTRKQEERESRGTNRSNLCRGYETLLRARVTGLLAAQWGINTG